MSDRSKLLKLGPQFREASFERASVNAESRTVTLSFSSAEPVERYWGMEVLGHDASECDLTRLNNKAAFLFNHDPDRQIGVVEKAWIQESRGMADIRFSKSEDAEEYFRDVLDGIRTKVSVGYRIRAAKLTGEKEGVETFRITWEPYEISLVSIPADDSVGVGRNAAEPETEVTITTDPTMKQNRFLNPDPAGGGGTAAPPAPKIEVNESAILTAERKRAEGILYLADKFGGKPEDAKRFIAEGKTTDEFFRHIADNRTPTAPLKAEDPNLGMSDKEAKRFSIISAARSIAAGRTLEGFEKEVCEAAAKHYRRGPTREGGFIVPNDVLRVETRAQNVGSFTAGGALVQTQYGPMIELLVNNMVTAKAGITMLTGIVGDLVYPQQTSGATAYWVSETGALTDSQAAFAQKTMTPKRCGATVPFTTQFLAQTSISAEAFLRSELMLRLALLKDLSILHGTGVGGQPLGIANTTGINATVTYGGAATWADLVEHETGITADNAEIGSMAFVLSAATVGKWKTILKDSVAGAGYLISENGTANGYPVHRTNQVSGNVSFFGVWSQLIHASWAGQEWVVDPYTLKKSGQIEITVNELCDNLVRQPLAFNVSTDTAAA